MAELLDPCTLVILVVKLTLEPVDCDTFGQKPYDGSEPEPDGTRFATLVIADTGVAAGTCNVLPWPLRSGLLAVD